MHLDFFTIVLLLATMSLLVGLGILAVWLQTRSEPGLLLWAVSFFLRVPAFPLLLLHGHIHDWLSVELANSLLMAGLGVSWLATRLYSRRSARIDVAIAPMVIWLAACQVPEIYADMGYRMLVTAVLAAVYSVAIGLEFWRGASACRGFREGLAVVFFLNAAMALARGGLAVTTELPGDLTKGGDVLSWSLFGLIILVMIGGMIAMGLYREQYLTTLKHDAEYDALTNTLNRRAFFAHADRVLHEHNANGNGATVALLSFDLDHFKKVNDSYGHLAGDQVLKHFALIIKSQLRRTDLFGRLGGEEFAALLPVASPEDTCQVAEKLRKAVSASGTSFGGLVLPVTVSIGIAEHAGKVTSLGSLLREADVALYEAKQNGRNRVRKYREKTEQQPSRDYKLAKVAEVVPVGNR